MNKQDSDWWRSARCAAAAIASAAIVSVLGARSVGAALLEVGEARGCPGGTAELRVTLDQEGEMLKGVQNDLELGPGVMIVARADGTGRPDCALASGVTGVDPGFSFRPFQCTPGVDCTGVRVLMISSRPQFGVSDGAPFYTCTLAIADDASGTFPVACENADGSDPDGVQLPTECQAGAVVVEECPPEPPECPGDVDGDGAVTIEELVQAVRSALNGCPEE